MSQDKSLTTQLQPLSGQRQNGESDAAVQACNDWLRMGSGRSIRQLIDNYSQQVTFSVTFEPPTTTYGTARQWASKFDWSSRATEYDVSWEDRKNAERERIFNQELAQDFGRLKKLITLARMLEAQIYEVGTNKIRVDLDTEVEVSVLHNVWLPDVKQIGSGDNAERVDIERFNSALINEYRSTLDDIAKEVGGRAKRHDIGNADGKELTIKVVYEDTLGSND